MGGVPELLGEPMRSLFEVYSETADNFERGGWTRGTYGLTYDGPACLIGGLNRGLVTRGSYRSWGSDVPQVVLDDVAKRLRRYPTYWLCRLIEFGPAHHKRWAIEMWNDFFPWRRRKTVVRVLRSLARKYKVAPATPDVIYDEVMVYANHERRESVLVG